ncbi:DUF3130 family protein [Listeria monocytogenes]|nr:DUF3130 family protein [Listeria monocytogenes]
MNEINVNDATLQKYASKLGRQVEAMRYLPMQDGNMTYSRANSISHFRTTLFDLKELLQ